ncbi:TonB family protein [Prosthecochloris sp. SCSIO W1103]|uniref:TonB family protein n=1 Tax=Prosthecochloris sp. SCSIO W1103 TaxID=2992244 RepID=UPI00223DF6D0|nr:TonB family protein [Prosthecochloris sp. SCSIO W1103]UZJ38341.1 TonB family protein [Prosthecochloris sp. SCSIO W1103]
MQKHCSGYILSFFFTLLFAAFSTGCTIDEENLENFFKPQPTTHIISAAELHKEYDLNVIAADMKYRSSVIIVYGVVLDIGIDTSDRAYVIIGAKKPEGIRCFFARKDMASLARLSKGQFVAIEGKAKSGDANTLVIDKARILSDEEEDNILPKPTIVGKDATVGKDAIRWVHADIMPGFLHQEKPEYPETARIAGIEGKVFVIVMIGKDGKPSKAHVLKRTPPEQTIFDKPAIDAVMNSTYEPAMQNGEPIETWLTIPIRFSLR